MAEIQRVKMNDYVTHVIGLYDEGPSDYCFWCHKIMKLLSWSYLGRPMISEDSIRDFMRTQNVTRAQAIGALEQKAKFDKAMAIRKQAING